MRVGSWRLVAAKAPRAGAVIRYGHRRHHLEAAAGPACASRSRSGRLRALARSSKGVAGTTAVSEDPFDVLVVGGGATGAGIALDAASRGLRTAMVNKGDFAAGTSSHYPTCMLLWGGIEYLSTGDGLNAQAPALSQFGVPDPVDAAERAYLATQAPHLVRGMNVMHPLASEDEYNAYCRQIYERDHGPRRQDPLPETSPKVRLFPRHVIGSFGMPTAHARHGALVYHDDAGLQNDARMTLSLIRTAATHGATALNYACVEALAYDDRGTVHGATVTDELTGDSFEVRAHTVVNACGPFANDLAAHDATASGAPTVPPVAPRASLHLVLPWHRVFLLPTPPDTLRTPLGWIDSRAHTVPGVEAPVFCFPWGADQLLLGTTETFDADDCFPPSGELVAHVLAQINAYHAENADEPLTVDDVVAVWPGLRPLSAHHSAGAATSDPGVTPAHIHTSASGLVTVSGGKWSAFRRMGEDTVDTLLSQAPHLAARALPSGSAAMPVVGSNGFDPETLLDALCDQLPLEVAAHLLWSYGTVALSILNEANTNPDPTLFARLVPGRPYIRAEVVHAVKHEMACAVTDVLARRTRLLFHDPVAASGAAPDVAAIMADILGWDKARIASEVQQVEDIAAQMTPDASPR